MESYTFLLLLAIILLSTKVLGLATERIQLPQVLGALLAGIILGPTGFGVLESTDFLVKTAEIGVIMLMFTAGIDTDMKELKATGVQAFVVALPHDFVRRGLSDLLPRAVQCHGHFEGQLHGRGVCGNLCVHHSGDPQRDGQAENQDGYGTFERRPH